MGFGGEMNEQNISKKIHIALSNIGARMFRNNVALAWSGNNTVHIKQKTTVNLNHGDVVIRGARPIRAGLCEGSSDFIGFYPVKITPDIVGKTVAIFTACEVKTNTGRASDKQKTFINVVKQAGGIAFIARSDDEAVNKCKPE